LLGNSGIDHRGMRGIYVLIMNPGDSIQSNIRVELPSVGYLFEMNTTDGSGFGYRVMKAHVLGKVGGTVLALGTLSLFDSRRF